MTCSKLIEGLFTKFNKRARHEKLDKKEIKKTFIFVKIVLYIALITVHKLGVGVYSKKKKKAPALLEWSSLLLSRWHVLNAAHAHIRFVRR